MTATATTEDIDLQWPNPEATLRELTTRAWSPFSAPGATEPADPLEDETTPGHWDGTVMGNAAARAGFIAWKVLTHDPDYADQLRVLSDGRNFVSDDFAEFILMLVTDAARAGAFYAANVKFTEAEMSVDRVVGAVAALMGCEQLSDEPLLKASKPAVSAAR